MRRRCDIACFPFFPYFCSSYHILFQLLDSPTLYQQLYPSSEKQSEANTYTHPVPSRIARRVYKHELRFCPSHFTQQPPHLISIIDFTISMPTVNSQLSGTIRNHHLHPPHAMKNSQKGTKDGGKILPFPFLQNCCSTASFYFN